VKMKDMESQANDMLQTIDMEYKAIFQTLSDQASSVAEAVKNLQLSLTDIKQELNSLNEYVAISLPGPAAAREALRISSGHIREVANELRDKLLRESRIIVWGFFKHTMSPTALATSFLSGLLNEEQRSKTTATWLCGKANNRIHGLMVNLPGDVQPTAILDMTASITAAHPNIRGISLDRPVHVRSRKVYSKETSDILVDSKLQKEPVVVLGNIRFPQCESSLEDSFTSLNSLPLSNSTPTKSYSLVVAGTSNCSTPGPRAQFKPSSTSTTKTGATGLNVRQLIRKPVITKHPNQGLLGSPLQTKAFFLPSPLRSKPPDKVAQSSYGLTTNDRLPK
jgi:hypothetical protein